MADIESAINWYEDRKGKVTYSMEQRRGPQSYDCSSALYLALIDGGFLPSTIYIGNTDSLFSDLENNGWTQLQPNAEGNFDTQRGDVFIWGVRGDSTGSLGHTGIFVDANNIDHCSYGYNGIATSNYDWLRSINGYPVQTFYRFTGTVSNNPTDQVVQVGSYIKFDSVFTVDDLQDISDVWQIRTNVLCPVGFTWADNGIPAAAVVETDSNGYATLDQVLNVSSPYKIPGKFQVKNVGQSNGRWLAEIEYNGLNFWVDLEKATEVPSDDPGTPTPQTIPVPPVRSSQSTIAASSTPPQPVQQPAPAQMTPTPSPVPAPATKPNTGVFKAVVSELESNKTILVNVVVTFFQTTLAAWAMTNFALDKLALTGAIGAGFSAVWNIVIKPALKALSK